MRLISVLEGAWIALRSNALRSLLTALGLVIGIASVVIMTSFGNGLQGLVMKQIASFDHTLTMVLPQTKGIAGPIAGAQGYLRDRDLAEIRRSVPGVRLAGAQVRRIGRLATGGRSWTTQLTGADADMLQMSNLRIVSGRLPDDGEQLTAARVVVIGDTVRRRLYPHGAAAGSTVRVNGTPMEIVGVVRTKGAGLGVDQDDIVYLPLMTVRRRLSSAGTNMLPPDAVQSIWLTFGSEAEARRARPPLERLLDARYSLSGTDLKYYSIVSMREQLQQSQKAVAAFGIAIAGIASISLLVGGIGIMNMMLVSVTERTSEIGLRMAIGAGPADVLRQFVAEALMLCLLGGLAGILLGGGVTFLLRKHVPDWPVVFDSSSMVLAVFVSCAIGLFFGIAPAVRASRLSPMDALKHV